MVMLLSRNGMRPPLRHYRLASRRKTRFDDDAHISRFRVATRPARIEDVPLLRKIRSAADAD